MAKSNKFTALSAALQGETLPEQTEEVEVPAPTVPVMDEVPVTVPTVTPVTAPVANIEPAKKGRQKGKRSDPNYIQVGVYIPKSLDKDAKRLLIDEEGDFSDLVTALLQDWVSSKTNNQLTG
jgi:hypothetical protein